MSGVGDDDSEEWDDPTDSTDPDAGQFGAGFIAGIIFTLFLQLALVGVWYIIVQVVL